jgi:hypothetical protein
VNRARVVALLEELRRELELEDEQPAEPRRVPVERRKISDIDKARARRALRKKGIPV